LPWLDLVVFSRILAFNISTLTEYRDTAVNLAGIDTGIVLFNTVLFGIGNSVSQRCTLSCLRVACSLLVAFQAASCRLHTAMKCPYSVCTL